MHVESAGDGAGQFGREGKGLYHETRGSLRSGVLVGVLYFALVSSTGVLGGANSRARKVKIMEIHRTAI